MFPAFSSALYSALRTRERILPSVAGCLRPRMRSRAAFRHAQHPLDRFKIHLANVRVSPGLFRVAEGRIKNAPLAVHLVPGDSEIVIRSVDARVVRIVEFCGVETEQDVDFVARPLLRLIDLVILHEFLWKVTDRGEARVFV